MSLAQHRRAIAREKIMQVPVQGGASLEPGRPKLLFEIPHKPGTFNYDLTADGQHFIVIQQVEAQQPATQINVVLNWFEELRGKVAASK